VRETFEEAGVLLARARDGSPFDAPPTPWPPSQPTGAPCSQVSATFDDVLDAHAAAVDLDALVPFARWITPSPSPRRFDTWFFAAAAPDGHAYEHDHNELVASEWVRPADALARAPRVRHRAHLPDGPHVCSSWRATGPAADFLADARARWDRPEPMRVMNPMQGWQLDLGTLADLQADDT
jgi:8-oxo-dGTP pyrophosphatase MutT (NUDIX family)